MGERKNKAYLSFWMDDETKAMAEALAEKQERSVGGLLRTALKDYLTRKREQE